MIIALCQINTTPNDFKGNVKKITDSLKTVAAAQAKNAKKIELALFPELTVCGYLVRDLVYATDFIDSNLRAIAEVCKESETIPNVTIVVGYIDRNYKGNGKPFANMAAVIRNGVVIARYQKQLLPFYDVFDEGRYFEPGNDLCVVNINGRKCGITICEDIWNDKGQDDYNYVKNPVAAYDALGVEVLINISSSPYVQDKPRQRHNMLTNITNNCSHITTIAYCNQIGGQDELVFDGNSTVVCHHRSDVVMFSATYKSDEFKDTIVKICDSEELPEFSGNAHWEEMLVLGLRDYIYKSGHKQVVLGSSGGIDSAVVAALACEAIGPENVICIMMPSVYSSEGSTADAKEMHKALGCREFMVPIKHESFAHYLNCRFGLEECIGIDMNHMQPIERYKEVINYNKVADENLQARMRGQIVMHYSNAMGALPLTTGNKTELAVGYCTLYGDMNGGFNPIGDLYKSEVYELANWLNHRAHRAVIPSNILKKAPSAELRPGQTDEASLLPYYVLDKIVRYYIENHTYSFKAFSVEADRFGSSELRKWLKIPDAEKEFNRITRLIGLAEFKRRQAAPTIKIHRVAFGIGRRLPIIKRFT